LNGLMLGAPALLAGPNHPIFLPFESRSDCTRTIAPCCKLDSHAIGSTIPIMARYREDVGFAFRSSKEKARFNIA
jgi:hypothetical protein